MPDRGARVRFSLLLGLVACTCMGAAASTFFSPPPVGHAPTPVGSATAVSPTPFAAGSRPAPSLTLLDEVGHLQHPVSPTLINGWKWELANGRTTSPRRSELHVWLGEWELARNEQPEKATWHFAQAQRFSHRENVTYGLAAYDTAIALFYEGAYRRNANAFKQLLGKRPLLGFEKDGVRLAIVNTTPNSAPASNGLAISYDHTRRLVQTLDGLRGFVHIRTARDALNFVRLRLPIAFAAFLGVKRSSGSVDGEIIEQSQLPDQSSTYTKYILEQGSGFEGVLSHEAFVAGGFHWARVKKLSQGFAIIRWIYRLDQNGGPHIARIWELVDFDGTYRATVLYAPEKTPKLPNTRWGCAGYA